MLAKEFAHWKKLKRREEEGGAPSKGRFTVERTNNSNQ